jgi:sugar lactone lactonase YvrE
MLTTRNASAVLIACAVLSHSGIVHGQSLTITTLAGPAGERGAADGIGAEAGFFNPGGVATDSDGNVYVADTYNQTIRKIAPDGTVTTLAGLAGSVGGGDGKRSAARFSYPNGVATDSSGNVYITANNRIRKITPAGDVTTLAGTMEGFVGTTDGTAAAAKFNFPNGAAVDPGGNVYIAEPNSHTIRKITPAGVVTTFAGLAGASGDADGTGSAARFNYPNGVATDGDGNVYVADRNNETIRKITPAGLVTTFAGLAGARGDADGAGSAARFQEPLGVATGGSGDVFVVSEHAIRKITTAGVVTTLGASSLLPGSTVPLTTFRALTSIAADRDGNVYAADISTIWKLTAQGEITTLAGWNIGSDDGTASQARFWFPAGAAADRSGNVYIADSANHTIRKISPSGVVSTFAGRAGVHGSADGAAQAARFWNPGGLTMDGGGNLLVADSANNTIRRITAAGNVQTIAGKAGVRPDLVNGTATVARFNNPARVVTDHAGNIYVVDKFNEVIRKITPAGIVSTLAGSRFVGTEDGDGTSASFNSPSQIAIDADDNLYVADTMNHTIRKITLSGAVTTFAGLAGISGSRDGPLSSALFNQPVGLAIDSRGNMYVSSDYALRMITPAGMVTTVAGQAGAHGSADGAGSAARFSGGTELLTDNDSVYVIDGINATIRVGRPVIADAATIDQASGPASETRLLGTSQQNATSWEWSIVRRPSGSTAILSSTSIRNPTFTPDVADLYQFRLVARGSGGTSMTVVSLAATAATPAPRHRTVRH